MRRVHLPAVPLKLLKEPLKTLTLLNGEGLIALLSSSRLRGYIGGLSYRLTPAAGSLK